MNKFHCKNFVYVNSIFYIIKNEKKWLITTINIKYNIIKC